MLLFSREAECAKLKFQLNFLTYLKKLNVFKMAASMEIMSCIQGYHIYYTVWTPTVGEYLICRREVGNARDRYAVGVYKQPNDVLVGHLHRKISLLCSLFLRHGGTITCQVTGRRQRSDLPQGGLDVPCRLLFRGKKKDVKKLHKSLLQ